MSICGGCSNFDPEPIDLRSWTPHLYPRIKNDCPGSTFGADWDVQDGGETVIQRVNGQQAMFCSDFNIFDDFDFFTGDVTFTGRVKVEEPPPGEDRDNDFFGFALGFRDGDESPGRRSARADYVLFDWKRRDPDWDPITGGDQRYSNSCREDDPGTEDRCQRYAGYNPRGTNLPVDQCGPVTCQDLLKDDLLPEGWNEATVGFAASQVIGLAHADLMWSHQACPAKNNKDGQFRSGFIQELGRGRRFGDQSWEYSDDRDKEWYDFRFDISADVMRVYIDDCETPEITVRARDLIGRNQFNNGQFCFYNYSQVSGVGWGVSSCVTVEHFFSLQLILLLIFLPLAGECTIQWFHGRAEL